MLFEQTPVSDVWKFLRRMHQHLNIDMLNAGDKLISYILAITLKPSNFPLITLKSRNFASITRVKPIRYPLPLTFKGSREVFELQKLVFFCDVFLRIRYIINLV
jgi:hypothetical protein